MPKKTLRELQKTKLLTVYNEDKGIIEKIVIPNNLQVGADRELLSSSVSVYGKIIAGNGISGSLTQLPDGTSYLIAGTNITISSQSNGPVTISSTGVAPGAGGSNTQVQFNNIGSLDGDSDFTFNTSTNTLNVNQIASTNGTFSGVVNSDALSGSLTQLLGGGSYLVAGSNITITTQSNGSILIESSGGGGGGSITATSGSATVANISEIIFDDGLFLVDNGDNTVTITSTIGEAEDGTYSDGLYTDFGPDTSIGVAIDRFNELFKLLAPAPAPDLDDVDVNVDGVDARLSFGSSNNLESEATPYYSVGTAAGFSAVDVNGSYSTLTSGNNLRAAIFNGSTNITGDLNEDVVADGDNYPDNSFGNADQGELRLEVNGTVVHTTDLTSFAGTGDPGSGTGTDVNGNGSGFTNVSTSAAGTLSNGTEFDNFQHRTGRYKVVPADQRQGWNYLRVLHVLSSNTVTTNYVEWVNDSDSNSLVATFPTLSITGGSIINLSGVRYHDDISATYAVTVDNAYRNVYNYDLITYTTSVGGSLNSGASFSLGSEQKPVIDVAGGEDHTKSLSLTATDSTIGASYMLNGSLTAGVNVTHPLKSNLSNSGQATASGILLYNLSNTSTSIQETFVREDYRILSGSYDAQSDLTLAGNVWNSAIHMTGSNAGYQDGLQFFNQRLYSPTNTLAGGDFTSLANAANNQPDYSGETGLRTFYRWFRNTTGATQRELSIRIDGSSTTIVPRSTSLDSGKIRVFIKFPNNTFRETGWLDLASEFVLDSYDDDDGAHVSNGSISFNSSINSTNVVSLGTIEIYNNEYVAVKIEADESWSGYISSISVDFNYATGTISPVPDLDDIDCNDTGVTAKLSFGSTKSITGYENVGTTAGFLAKGLNDTYQVEISGNNLRRAVFDGTETIEGELNEDVAGSGDNYVNNSFSDANSGSINLEVNGSVVHTVDLTGPYDSVGSGFPGSGAGSETNANGSGFVNLSYWKPAEYSNDVPDYTEIYRTGTFRVVPDDQRDGWNYVRVIHSIPGLTDRETNYVEWVNDSESQNNNLSSSIEITQFGDDEIFYLSGVKYFTQPTGSIIASVDNVYKNVYQASPSAIQLQNFTNASGVRIIQNGDGLSSSKTTESYFTSYQTLGVSTDSQSETLYVTGTIQFTQSTSLSGSFTSDSGTSQYSCGGRIRFTHPIKTYHTTSNITTTNMLVYSSSDTSDIDNYEYFTGEEFRRISGSYDFQEDTYTTSNLWDSTVSINDTAGNKPHSTGLIVYDTFLMSPFNAGNAGNFRNKHESSNPSSFEGPDDNVDYSSLTESNRQYHRVFYNQTSDDRPSITIVLYGDAKLVGKSGANYEALGENRNINVSVKIPEKTGWLDLGKASEGSGNTSDGDGCLSGDIDNGIDASGATNVCTFNGQTADGSSSGSEYIMLLIDAHKDWTGYLSRIDVEWRV